MNNSDYVCLHTHTTRSLLDGYTKVPDLVDTIKAHGQLAVAVTDHGSMGAIPELWRESERVGIKAIAGIEAYVTEDRFSRGGDVAIAPYFHLTLLAQNANGYANLCKMSSISYIEGHYHKPRIDLNLLEKHAGGIIALSGCIGGVPQQSIIHGNVTEGLKWCARMKELLGNRFFLESQETGEPEQKIVNSTFIEWTKKHGYKHVVTTDSHYTKKGDSDDHDTLLCIGLRKEKSDVARMKFIQNEYHIKSTQEMYKLGFPKTSITNSRMIADMCETYALPKAGGFPRRENAYELLETAAMDGLTTRLSPAVVPKKDIFGHMPQADGVVVVDDDNTYWERLMEELAIIRKLKYEHYFLIAHDIVKFAREHNMWWSWGRGSSVGSLVAYSLGITGMDPVKYHLYFERFLNGSRKNPPDIDMDFTDEDRPHIIEFVEKQYGAECVSHIATFGTLGPRQLIMDLCKVLGKSKDAEKMVLASMQYDPTAKISDMLEDPAFIKGITTYLGKEVLEYLRKFDGIPRHGSVHAAGVVIDREPLAGKIPMMMPRKVNAVKASQYVYEDLVSLGFEKFDILGVRTLRTIKETATLTGVDLSSIPMDDAKTFDLLFHAKTIGIFQLESWGCRKFISDFRPKNFEDVMMTNALYRPGPMQGGRGLGELVGRRNGNAITYAHASLEPILKNTYGIMVYQEQVMAVVRKLAGWTLEEADMLRYAVGKKKTELLGDLRDKFYSDCIKNGHTKEFAKNMFDDIQFFGRYGWNKAHAAAYGMVTYCCAYFKANYPAEYLCCMLNSEESDPKHRQELIAECARMGIKVARPHVNRSQAKYQVDIDDRGSKFILSGLSSVSHMGDAGVAALLDARHILGNFTSHDNFRERVPKRLVNSLAVKNLIIAGAFKDMAASEQLELDVPF